MVIIGCVIILVTLIYIIYILSRYSGTQKYEKANILYYRNKNFTEYSPFVWSYIINRKFKKETIVATVLMYVKRGYITMTKKENDYEFKIVQDLDDINKLDLWAINFFFINNTYKGSRQYLSNFNRYYSIEKHFGMFKKFKKSANKSIRNDLKEMKIINYVDEKKNKFNIIFSYIMVLITLTLSVVSLLNKIDVFITIPFIIGYSLLIFAIEKSDRTFVAYGVIFLTTYFFEGDFDIYKLFLSVVIILTLLLVYLDDKVLRVKGENGQVVEKALGLKRYIQDFSNIKQYDLEQIHIWDEYYVYAVALNIKKI